MANGYTKTDDRGNPYKLVSIKERSSRGGKSYSSGYVEIKGDFYAVQTYKGGDFVKLTQLPKRQSYSRGGSGRTF